MKITVNKKVLLEAIDKANICVKDTYVFSVTDRKISSANDEVYANLISSNGNVQANPVFSCISDESKKFIVGSEFADVLKAIGEFGETYEITVGDTMAQITCGTASIPIALKTDATLITPCSPKKETCMQVEFERESFKKAIRKGSFAYAGPEDTHEAFRNTVALFPGNNGENATLTIVSSNAWFATCSVVQALKADEKYLSAENENKNISIDATITRNICSKLVNEKISLFIFDKQVIIRDGNDTYIIVRYNTTFPAAVMNLFGNKEYQYKAKFDTTSLKAGIKVATILNKKGCKARLILGEVAKIASSDEKNIAQVKASEIEGEINIIINAKHIEMALSDMNTESVSIFGNDNKSPIYITSEDAVCFTLPFREDENADK